MQKQSKIIKQHSVFSQNLKRLLTDQGLNQTKLANKLDVSVASINNYLKDVNDPPVNFLLKLKLHFSIDIDDFLTKIIEDETTQENKEAIVNSQKYKGNYILYYYQSSAYKGAGFNPVKDPVKYGVLSVFPSQKVNDSNNFKMISLATFFTSRKEAKEFKENLDALNDKYAQIQKHHDLYEQNFKGTLTSTNTQVFINLSSSFYNDKVLIILNNPPAEKAYVGGIGTVNSVSRGREPAPVIQYIILSKYLIDMQDSELYNILSLSVENIDVRNEAMKLLEQFKSLYLDSNINLEEYQKNHIMQNNIERSVVDVVKRNMFLYGKVSNREDDKYYRLIMSYKNK
jgi:transcriptional regulator with XRE-family HTH domain